MAEAKKASALSNHPARFIVWGVIILVLIIIIGSALSTYLGGGEESATTPGASASASGPATVVATISCNPNETVWAENGGWCTGHLDPGTYTITLKRWDYQIAQRATLGEAITQYERVPEKGIPVGRFNSKPYQAQFKIEAPRGDLELVAAPLYRVNGVNAAPVQSGRFTLTEEGSVEIGINMIPGLSYYEGGKGGMTVEISRIDG